MLCPIHAAQKSAQQRARLTIAAEQHNRDGGETLFLTLTAATGFAQTPRFYNAEYSFRHDKEAFAAFRAADDALPRRGAQDRLKLASLAYAVENDLPTDSHEGWDFQTRLDAVMSAKSATFSGRKWRGLVETFGVKATAHTVELAVSTRRRFDGSRDWSSVKHNLHLHTAVFLNKRLSPPQREALIRELRDAWLTQASRQGLTASRRAQSFEWVAGKDTERVMSYITKYTANAAPGTTSLTAVDALHDAAKGDMWAKDWFRNAEQVFHNRRIYTTSVRFDEAMGITDTLRRNREQYRATTTSTPAFAIPAEAWVALNKVSPEARTLILNAIENGTATEVLSFLQASGLPFIAPGQPNTGNTPEDAPTPATAPHTAPTARNAAEAPTAPQQPATPPSVPALPQAPVAPQQPHTAPTVPAAAPHYSRPYTARTVSPFPTLTPRPKMLIPEEFQLPHTARTRTPAASLPNPFRTLRPQPSVLARARTTRRRGMPRPPTHPA